MHKHRTLIDTLTVFSSFSTLFCCALPALFVAVGAGAALAGLVTEVPQLVWLSEHKNGLFLFAGGMLTLSGVLRHRAKNAPCPTEPALAKACASLKKKGGWIYGFSLCIYATGLFFAYVAPYLRG